MTKNCKKKDILLTFDYELFLGRKSGTPTKCLIEPTRKLLDVLERQGIKAAFFIDVLYYARLLECKATDKDATAVRTQLKEIVQQGSSLELHLHPQWLDAQYEAGQWSFPTYDSFRLHQLAEQDIVSLFVSGKALLEEIARESDPDYRVTAFRAGGFCIQPFRSVLSAFAQSGISIDSSVAPGTMMQTDTHAFNFMHAPNVSAYRFTDDPTRQKSDGPFVEVPIATYRKGVAAKIARKVTSKLWPSRFRCAGDGYGIDHAVPWWRKLSASQRMLTLDGEMLPHELAKQVQACPRDLVTIISHPKSLSSVSLQCLDVLAAMPCRFVGIADVEKHGHV